MFLDRGIVITCRAYKLCLRYHKNCWCETRWILYSRGRVSVHHLSLSSGHCRNGNGWWQPPPITVPAEADPVFLFVDVCKWIQMSGSWWILGRLSVLFLWTRGWDKKATPHCCSDGGLNSRSGGELKLYLKWKETRNSENSELVSLSLPTTWWQTLMCILASIGGFSGVQLGEPPAPGQIFFISLQILLGKFGSSS